MQVVERWILARLRDRRFFGLGELNGAIAELLLDLNARSFKKLPGCRASAFEVLDRPALRALPASRMPIARFKRARVNIFCGVSISVAVASRCSLRRRSSVPYDHRTLRYSERRNCIKSDPIRCRGALPEGSSCAMARAFIWRSICA